MARTACFLLQTILECAQGRCRAGILDQSHTAGLPDRQQLAWKGPIGVRPAISL